MSIDKYHHLFGQTFPGKTVVKCTLMLTTERSIHLTALSQRTPKERGYIKTRGSGELPWQIASNWGLQRRAMADPLPYIIILTCYIKMLGQKVSQAENSHIYGYVYVCLCVSVKKKLIFILLPSAL